RPEDRLSKASQCFRLGAARFPDLGVDLAEVEEPPAQRAAGLRLKRRRSEEVTDVHTLEAEETGDRELRIVFAECGADPGVRCRETPLRGDHVRPPPENVDRFVALGNGRDRRNRSLAPELRRVSTRL